MSELQRIGNKDCGTCASYQDAGFGILDCDTCETDAQQNWKPCRSYLIEQVRILTEGLSSISKNTCCDNCREAALVASDALARAACA